MLISDSMSLLWLVYAVLSLVVLLTGYLGLAFLPRLPRLVVTWAVAGVMWVPASFRLPLLEEGEFYTGLAPAVVVAAITFLENDAAAMLPATLLVAAGALVGALLGGLLGWQRQRRAEGKTPHRPRGATPSQKDEARRREPVIG
ncbi:hypothetical protein [Halomonas cerina]|uniref:Uncharacterized protein n=1 Tax=Halomonas cerina TaxID=447424 RepID=A0A839V0J1_9GAMM|nr:hypothetical protein [Halomonas cerina]MBB3189283.1 hypothetical protein [Halomonas cerina]